jgi:Ferritin-like domain
MPSRREILASSAAFAGAALLGACGGGDSAPPDTETVSDAQMVDDAAVLGFLLDMEESTVVAYSYLSAQLDGPALALARQFGGHEREHAFTLRRAMSDLGKPAGPAKPASEYRKAFPPLHSARDALGFALDLEQTAIGAYGDAFGKLFTDTVRATLATIMATEAEQAAVWLGRLGRPQVPDAFVTGPPPSLEDE